MSLSSFLLGKGVKDIDEGLDALLRSSTSTLPTSADIAPASTGFKRRREDATAIPVKRKKSVSTKESPFISPPSTTNPVALHSKKAREGNNDEGPKKPSKTEKLPEESDEEDAGLEEAYERKVSKGRRPTAGSSRSKDQPNHTSDSEGDPSQLAHETATKKDRRNKTRPRHVHHVPHDETKEQRDARTIFLGNVPMEVIKGKAALKDLKRHILSHVPEAKIESLRFRSVAFERPTSAAPAPRTHSLERTAEWRTAKGDEASAPQPRLSAADKKRVAFIKHDFHAEADAVTVYVVFAYGGDLAPDEAAKRTVAALDNSLYLGCTLRADIVGGASSIGDPKCTVFVGSLDFASREEDLRVFFEGVVSAERGPRSAVAGDSDSDDEEGTGGPSTHGAKPKTWVTRVRIVRDKDTQLGKGFAYIQFADRECVDEILALEPGKLKFAKRKLRVERCKTLPSSLNVLRDRNPHPSSAIAPPRSARPPPSTKLTPATVPKGNPDLGAQMAHLSKAERKAAKAADPERVARRLSKKKARHTLQIPEQGKDRVRVRKSTAEHKGASAATRQKKSRVRSERSITRRNTKK